MIKEFDRLISDSMKKGISIFKNPQINSFVMLCNKELSMPEAYDALKEHAEENEQIFLAHMSDSPTEILTIDTALIKLRHFIYQNFGVSVLQSIQVIPPDTIH